MDKVYYISRCTLKTANKQYSSLKNDYEMTFNNDTVMEECTDNTTSVPGVQYNFIPVSELANKDTDSTVGKYMRFFFYNFYIYIYLLLLEGRIVNRL